MLWLANRDDLLMEHLPPKVLRYALTASLVPVVVFLGSIPLAFVSTKAALYSWLLIIVLEFLVDRWLEPDGADELLP